MLLRYVRILENRIEKGSTCNDFNSHSFQLLLRSLNLVELSASYRVRVEYWSTFCCVVLNASGSLNH